MSNPLAYLVRMVIFLVAVVALAFVLRTDLIRVFSNTPILDGVIVTVLLLGIFFVFRQVILIRPEVEWVRRFQARDAEAPPPETGSINLLVPLAAMIGERHDQIRLSPTATRALLDGIAMRLDERRELARYIIGLLIFLGLLGTFWGLLQTISSVADAISGLQVTAGDPLQMFAKLKGSIEGPLTGMSTAFGASLFGLSGSLVLGFLELQASQAQGRFHIELEEWLARATSLSSGSLSAEASYGLPSYIQALLEKNAEGVDGLVRALQRIEDSRQATVATHANLAERLAALADTLRIQQTLLARFTELSIDLRGSVVRLADRTVATEEKLPRALEESERKNAALIEDMRAAINRMAEDNARSRAAVAEDVRATLTKLLERFPDSDREAALAHQRKIEATLAQLIEDGLRDRAALADELRGELRLMARTIALSQPTDGG